MNPIIHIPEAILGQCRQIHANEIKFGDYLAAGQNIVARRWELIEKFTLNPSGENQAELESFMASLPTRQGIMADVASGRFTPSKLRSRQLAAVLQEPVRQEISKLEDLLRESIANDTEAAAEFGTDDMQSAKTRSLDERISIARRYWESLKRGEAQAAKTLSRLGYYCGDLAASADEAIAAHRREAGSGSSHLRHSLSLADPVTPSARMGLRDLKLGLEAPADGTVTASAKPRKKLEVEMLAH